MRGRPGQAAAETLDFHPNGMQFTALADGTALLQRTYYSVGGGFIVTEGEHTSTADNDTASPYAFSTAAQLLELTQQHQMPISGIMLAHERVAARY